MSNNGKKVTIYTKNGCQPCRMTKMKFEKSGVDYVEKNINDSVSGNDYREEALALGFMQMPVVVVEKDGITRAWSGLVLDKITTYAVEGQVEVDVD